MCLQIAMCSGTSLSSRAMCPKTEMRWAARSSPNGLRAVRVSEPVLNRNREGCGKKDIRCKTTLRYMAGLTLALVCVATTGLLVVIQ